MKKIPFYLFISVSIICCKNYKNHEPKINEVVFLPKNLELYIPFSDIDSTYFEIKKSHKIFTLLDVSCSSCFPKFKKWNDFQTRLDSFSNVKVVSVCYSQDNFELVRYLFENKEIEKVNFIIL